MQKLVKVNHPLGSLEGFRIICQTTEQVTADLLLLLSVHACV